MLTGYEQKLLSQGSKLSTQKAHQEAHNFQLLQLLGFGPLASACTEMQANKPSIQT